MPGLKVVRVHARDADSGRNGKIRYAIVENEMRKYFEINFDNGEIITKISFDADVRPTYLFTVLAEDRGEVRLNGSAFVQVSLLFSLFFLNKLN